MTPSASCNPKYFILQTGDLIENGDEYYNPVDDCWLPVEAEFIGSEWSDDESKPVRRKNPDWVDGQEFAVGAEVFWNDPDNGLCSRYAKVSAIVGNVYRLRDSWGGEIEAFKHELS